MPGYRIDRRTFLLANLAMAAGAGAQTAPLETLTQWMNASTSERERALQSLADRVRSRDADIRAWVQIASQPVTGKGKLQSIPFGVKDIIETRGLATEYGSPIYKGRIGTSDAAIVRLLRERGGVLLGKTHTTAFAYRTPSPTRNPRNLNHTPGGSSSGSAAAVAAGMVPFAIGTQTGGSTIRPASYCGVTGFKPTYGVLSNEGVLPLGRSLDTIGFFTHTADDMLLLWDAIGQPTGRDETITFGVPEPLPDVEASMAAALQESVGRLRRVGVQITGVDLRMMPALRESQRTVMFYEGARFHQQRYQEYGDRLEHIAELVRDGLKITESAYGDARRSIGEARARMAVFYKTTPVILYPGATGPAPAGLSNTGDSSMNAPWTALGTPAISIPMPVASGLPLGLQLTANPGEDARVIRSAVAVRRILAA